MNRRNRRKLEKKLGLKNKSVSFKERINIIKRKQKAGKQIHKQFLQDNHNNEIRNKEIREQKAFDRLLSEGKAPEDIKRELYRGE